MNDAAHGRPWELESHMGIAPFPHQDRHPEPEPDPRAPTEEPEPEEGHGEEQPGGGE